MMRNAARGRLAARDDMAVDPRYENPVSVLGMKVLRRTRDVAVKHARVPGLKAMVRQERCTGCGACVRKRFCRFDAISVEEKKAQVNDRACRGCTRCTHLCPKNAFVMEIRPPAIVRETMRTVDREITRAVNEAGNK